MTSILENCLNDRGLSISKYEIKKDTEITSRFLDPSKIYVIHPLLFELGLFKNKMKIPKKIKAFTKFSLSASSAVIDLVAESKEMMKTFVYIIFCAESCFFHNMEPEHKRCLIRIIQNELSFKPKVLAVGCCDGSCSVLAEADTGVKILDEKNANTYYADFEAKSFCDFVQFFKILSKISSVQYRFIEKVYFFKVVLMLTTLFLFQYLCGFSACAIIDYDLYVIYDILISFLTILSFSYSLDYDNNKSKPSTITIIRFLDKSLIKTGCSAVIHSIITLFMVTKSFEKKIADFGEIGLILFINTNLTLFVQILFYKHQIRKFFICCLFYLILIIIIISSIFHFQLGNYDLLSSTVLNFEVFLLVILLSVFTSYILSCSLNILLKSYNKETPYTRFEEYKNRFKRIFAYKLNWRFFNSWMNFRINKLKMKFFDKRLENRYKLQVYQGFRSVLIFYYSVFTFIQLMNTLMELAGKAVFFKFGNYSIIILVYLFSNLVAIFFVRSAYMIFSEIALFSPILILSILKALLNNSISSIPRYPIYIIVFVLDLNFYWYFTVGKAVFLYLVSIFAIVYESYVTDIEDLALQTTIWSILMLFLGLLTLFTSYFKDFYKRKEFNFMNKLNQEVEKSSAVFSYLLPDFIKSKSKQGINYLVEDKGSISIIYCEIFEFDRIITECDPDELGFMLNEINEQINYICNCCGVIKVQNTGKYFLACTGIKDSEEFMDSKISKINHPRRAIEMALALVSESEKWILNNGKKITIKIGIHSGPAVAGVVGYRKPQFTILGETVKTAKFLAKSLIEQDAVQISAICFDLLQDTKGLKFKENRVDFKSKFSLDTKIVSFPTLNYDLDSLDNTYIKFIRRKSSFSSRSFSSNRAPDYMSGDDTQQINTVPRAYSRILKSQKSTKLTPESMKFSEKLKLNIKNFWKTSEDDRSYFQDYSNLIKIVQDSGLLMSLICDFLLIVAELAFALVKAKSSSYARLTAVLAGEAMMLVAYFMKKRYVRRRLFGFVLSGIYSSQFFMLFFAGLVTDERDLVYFVYFFYKYLLICFFTGTIFKQNFYFHVGVLLVWLIDMFRNYNNYQYIVYIAGYIFVNISMIYRQETHLRVSRLLNSQVKREFSKTQENLMQTLPPYPIENLGKSCQVVQKIEKVTLIEVKVTGLAEWSLQKSSVEILSLLSNLFSEFDRICGSYFIYKIRTEEEKYFAISYLDEKNRQPVKETLASINFAFKLLEIMAKVNSSMSCDLGVQISLHTDEILGAVIGTKVLRFDIYGESVSVCKKISKIAPRHGIFISEKTLEILKSFESEFIFESLGDIFVSQKTLECFLLEKRDELIGYN